MLKVTKTSQFSGKSNTMELDVTMAQLERFERREDLVQNIFPHLNADEREFLMTGCTPEEWDAMFPEENAEETPSLLSQISTEETEEF